MSSPSKLRFGKELNDLSITDIQSLINNRIDESQNLDYKKPTTNPQKDCDNLAEAISSFLNTDGGLIIYGVSELQEGKHRYPDKIIWSKTTKETIEQLLISRIQPWDEKTRIFRIEKTEEIEKGIFVIEVPKSNNPPHMYNHKYYQRMNFQSKPMGHENVSRAFHTSWIRRKELSENVLEPIYAEIKSNFNSIKNFAGGINDSKFNKVISEKGFLYDQLSQNLRKQIEDFYSRRKELSNKIPWTDHISRQIINNQICIDFPKYHERIKSRQNDDLLQIKVISKDLAGLTNTSYQKIKRAFLLRKDPMSYLKSIMPDHRIIAFEPIFRTIDENPITHMEFNLLWAKCEGVVSKNKTFISIWRETPRLLKLGKEIIEAIKENRI